MSHQSHLPSLLPGLVVATVLMSCGAPAFAPIVRRVEVAEAHGCRELPLAVQVLGSGGPIADDDRASSGYLLWQGGRARLLVDAGGGVALRFAQSGARMAELDAVLLTHLHVDHVADLPALLKSASFFARDRDLPLVGPMGSNLVSGPEAYLRTVFDREAGSYPYLGGFLDGRGASFRVVPEEVDASAPEASLVWRGQGAQAFAVGVPHGVVPALGYVVEVGDHRIAFTGDQRMDDARFATLADGVELLIAHHAVPEGVAGAGAALHAQPSAIGRLAARVGAGHLVLSHHMARSLADVDGALATIRAVYEGPITFAQDLDCIELPR